MTPNTSVALEDDKIDSGLDDNGPTPQQQKLQQHPQPPQVFRVTKNHSLGNIPLSKRRGTNRYDDDDQVDSGLDEKYAAAPAEISFGAIYRMKSLSSLDQAERSFGDTPKELLMLKEEFERRRFELTRRRSLTSLLADNEDETDAVFKQPTVPKRESIFTAKSGSTINGKYKKKFGIGDTKYIGNDDSVDSPKQFSLTKMKSLGTIPDLVAERVNFEPFLTPLTQRRHPVSLHDYRSGQRVESNSSSSDGDEEAGVLFRHQTNDAMRFVNETSLLNGPFERGFRRSYSRDPNRLQKPTTPLRQSDGYFQMPHFPVLRRSQLQRPTGPATLNDLKTRSSLHNLPTNGKIDVIRYASSG